MIRAIRILLYLIAALVVVVGLLLAFLATSPGRAVVASIVERAAAGSGLSLSIGRLTGWPPFSFGADKVVIADANGPFAEIDGLAVDLSLRGLLSRTISFDALSAERIVVIREPVLPPSGTSSGNAALLPLAAREFSVARLELGEGLIGRPAALSVTGAFATTRAGGIDASLDAKRIDGGAGALSARVSRTTGEARLMIDATLEEAADGILLALMGRDSGPGYRLVAKTGLDAGVFDGAVSLTSDGNARFSGQFTLTPSGENGQRLTVSGEGDLAELVPPAFADFLSGAIRVAVDADWQRSEGETLPRIVIREGKLATGTVRAEASGSFGGAATDLKLSMEASRADGGSFVLPLGGGESLAFDSVDLSGRVAPSGGVTRLDLIGRAAGFAVDGISAPAIGLSLAVEAEGDDPLADRTLPFAFRAEADSVDIAGRTIPGGEATPLVLTANGTLDLDAMSAETTAELNFAGGKVTYAGIIAASGVTGRAEAAFTEIAPLAGLFGQPLHGGLSLSADGSFAGNDGLALKVAAQGASLDTGEPVVTNLLGSEPRISATISDGPEGRVAITDLSVEGAQVSMTGEASLAGSIVEATLNGRIADLGALAEGTTGVAELAAKVTGSIDAPNIDATVTVAEGTLLDQTIADASVRFEGAPTEGGWQGTLTLGGTLAGQPIAGTARAEVADGGLSFPDINLTIAENRITGALAQTGEGLLSGSLDVEASNLKTLAAMALVEATGSASARATFTPENGRQGLAVNFAARDLAVDTVAAGQVEGEARIDDLFGAPTIAGRADLGSVAVGSIAIDTAMVSAEVVQGSTSFKVSAAGPDLTLAGTGSLAAGTGGQTVRLDTLAGTAFGFPVDLAGPATVAVENGKTRVSDVTFAAGGGRVSVSGVVAPALDLRIAAASVAASFVNQFVPGLEADGTVSGNATVTGSPDAPAFAWDANWTDFAVDATRSILPPLAVTARGRGDMTATTVDAQATGGGLTLTATGKVPLSGEGVELSIDGRSTGLDLGQPVLARLLSGETTLAANVTTGPNGRIAVSGLSIGGTGLTATGDLTLQGDTIDGTFDGRIADLSLLAEESDGAAEFNAKVSGSISRPNIDATVIIADGMVLDQKVSGATVRFQGAPTDGGGWDGALTLAGNFAGYPLSGTARAEIAGEGGGLSFPEVNLGVGENHITGAIERTAAGLLSGSLDVVAPNLKSLAAIMLIEATGAAQGRIVFTPEGDRQSVSVSFNGSKIAMPSLTATSVDGQIQIENAFGIPLVRGNAAAKGLIVGGVRLDTATVTASVVDGATQFEAAARGPELDLSGTGSLADDNGAQVVRLTQLKGDAFGFPANIASPATVRIEGGTTTISGVNLSVGGGSLTVNGTIATAIDLKVAVTNVAGASIDRFSPGLGAAGTISGSATVTGTPAAPRATWQINWTGFSVAAMRNAGVPGFALTANGAATDRATTIDASLAGSGVSLRVTGNVPFAGSGLQVRAQGTAPLGILPVGSSTDIALAGTVRMDVSVTGSTSRASINGTFDLVDARAADASDGIGLTAINGRIRFDGATAHVESLTARLTQGGDLTVAGTVRIDPGFPANLTIRIRNGRYLDGEMINANFNADLTLTGPVDGAGTIAGHVDLGRTEVLLPDSFGGGPPITVEHIDVAPGFVPPMEMLGRAGTPPPVRGGGSGGLNLNITVNSTNVIFVRGFGLDAELGGSIRIAGTTGNPQPVGGFQMRRGRIEVLGRRFDFSRGVLTFQGDLEPVLDFEATTTAPQITVTVHVTGRASDPEIRLTSSPSMPEEEIISRLLFGRSIGSLSAFQVIRLVDAVAEFSGAYGRDGGIFARVRRTVGLDDLDIDQNASGGTTIGIGKQLTDSVRVGVQTETNGTSRVTLDVDLTKNLKAQIEGSADGDGSIGLTYEKEY